jgi:hypothetical protein
MESTVHQRVTVEDYEQRFLSWHISTDSLKNGFDLVCREDYYRVGSARHYIRREGGGDTLAKIDSFSFGSITVDGKKYRRDLFLLPDGTVKQRKGGFWIFGSHNLKKGGD